MPGNQPGRRIIAWVIGSALFILAVVVGVILGSARYMAGRQSSTAPIAASPTLSLVGQVSPSPVRPIQTPTIPPTNVPTPAVRPTNEPPLGAAELTRLQVALQPGEQTCVSISEAFGFSFYDPLVRAIHPRYFYLNYTVEGEFEWPPGLQGGIMEGDATTLCLSSEESLPRDRYYIPHRVVIYVEQSLQPDPGTRLYLTEGVAYLQVNVGVISSP